MRVLVKYKSDLKKILLFTAVFLLKPLLSSLLDNSFIARMADITDHEIPRVRVVENGAPTPMVEGIESSPPTPMVRAVGSDSAVQRDPVNITSEDDLIPVDSKILTLGNNFIASGREFFPLEIWTKILELSEMSSVVNCYMFLGGLAIYMLQILMAILFLQLIRKRLLNALSNWERLPVRVRIFFSKIATRFSSTISKLDIILVLFLILLFISHLFLIFSRLNSFIIELDPSSPASVWLIFGQYSVFLLYFLIICFTLEQFKNNCLWFLNVQGWDRLNRYLSGESSILLLAFILVLINIDLLFLKWLVLYKIPPGLETLNGLLAFKKD